MPSQISMKPAYSHWLKSLRQRHEAVVLRALCGGHSTCFLDYPMFAVFCSFPNNGYLLTIGYVFHKFHHSWIIPDQRECISNKPIYIFAKSETLFKGNENIVVAASTIGESFSTIRSVRTSLPRRCQCLVFRMIFTRVQKSYWRWKDTLIYKFTYLSFDYEVLVPCFVYDTLNDQSCNIEYFRKRWKIHKKIMGFE